MLLIAHASLLAGSPRFVPGSVLVKIRQDRLNPSSSLSTTQANAIVNALAHFGAGPMLPVWKPEFTSTIARRFGRSANGTGVELSSTYARVERLASEVIRIYRVRYTSAVDPDVVAAELSRVPGIEYAEPEPLYELYAAPGSASPSSIPNDPLYGSYLTYQSFPAAWDTTKGDSTVVICIIDTGVQYTHPDLMEKIWTNPGELGSDSQGRDKRANGIDDDGNGYVDDWRGWNFDDNSNDPAPTTENHGTGTSSMAAGHTNNGIGISGSGYQCRYMAVKGIYIEAMLYAAVNNAVAANCSFGSGFYSRAMNDIVEFATNVGTLVVCAAGNSNNDTPNYPAAYPSALSVGSVDFAGNGTPNVRSGFSSYGYTIDVLATGNGVNGCNFGGYFQGGSGTSFSSPIVAGLAGLIKTVHPDWGARRIGAQIRATSFSIDASNPQSFAGKLGHGRIDAYAALTQRLPGLTVQSFVYTPATATVSAHIVNYGYPTRDAQFALRASPGIQIASSSTISGGAIATGDSIDVTFAIALSPSIDYTSQPIVRLDITDPGTGYGDFACLEFFPWVEQASFPQLTITDMTTVNRSTAWGVADNGNFMRTTDRGFTWASGAVPSSTPTLSCVAAVDDLTAYIAEGAGAVYGTIHRTTDGGDSWTQVYAGPPGSSFTGLRFVDRRHGAGVLAIAGADSSLFVITGDAGATWKNFPAPRSSVGSWRGTWNSLCMLDSLRAWFSGADSGRVSRTTDGGRHWSVSRSENTTPVQSVFVSAGFGVAGSSRSQPYLSRTYDGGEHWTATAESASEISALTTASGTTQIWAAGFTDHVTYSNDGGLTWGTERIPPLGLILTLAACHDGDSCHIWGASQSGVIVHRSLPALNAPPPAYLSFDTRPLDLGNLDRALARRDTILYATNTGGAPDTVTTSLDNVNLPADSAVSVSPTSFILGAGETKHVTFTVYPGLLQPGVVYYSGVVLTSAATTGPNPLVKTMVFSARGTPNSVQAEDLHPQSTRLEQNYPNPFNPVTTIGFRVAPASQRSGEGEGFRDLSPVTRPPQSGTLRVKLAVYDVLGREVAVLADETRQSGSYTVHFDGSRFPSGTYFVRMRAGEYVGVKRMVLVR